MHESLLQKKRVQRFSRHKRYKKKKKQKKKKKKQNTHTMGTGERGKGQRRRQKALKEGRTYDKKNNTFREHDVSYVEKALKADTMLEAPSSFKRFMRAQEEIKKRQMRQIKT